MERQWEDMLDSVQEYRLWTVVRFPHWIVGVKAGLGIRHCASGKMFLGCGAVKEFWQCFEDEAVAEEILRNRLQADICSMGMHDKKF